MFRLFRQRARGWQLLLVSIEFGLLMGGVYAAVVLRYWEHAGTQAAFSPVLLHWRAPLVAIILVLAMVALGLCQVYLRSGWLGRLSRQGVAFVLGATALPLRLLPGRRRKKFKFDPFYVKNHNFVFDPAILVQTVEVVLFVRGAR